MPRNPAAKAYRPGPAYWALLLLIAAAGSYLRLWAFGDQIILDDEWHAINKLKSSGYWGIFTSFGWADHSIALTLYYELLARTIGLTELGMQLPPLVFGIVTIFAVPWLVRPWTDGRERICLAALLAVAPALVHFSRYARPYAITMLLCVAAAVWFYRWWIEGDRRRAAGYALCTALAAWLHPVTLAFTLAAPLWAGLLALEGLVRERDSRPLLRVTAIGMLTIALCAALLGPPVYLDYASLSGKSGVDFPDPGTFLVAWQLIAGTGFLWVAGAALAVCVYGLVRLARRDPQLARYLALVITVATLLVSVSGAMWLQQGIVLMRYLLPVLPVALLGIALGMVGLADLAARKVGTLGKPSAQAAGLVLVSIALYGAGPLPEQFSGVNQFTDHMYYQFDYDTGRSGYRQYLAQVPVPAFYSRIAGSAEGEGWEVIESPWRLESHFNPVYKYQQAHQLPVKIGFIDDLCGDDLYGEYEAESNGLEFRHFIHLEELLEDPGARRFLVIHRKPAIEGWRKLPSVEPCIRAFRDRFGQPWHESESAVVFRFGSESDDP